jgi:hypothetical protein
MDEDFYETKRVLLFLRRNLDGPRKIPLRLDLHKSNLLSGWKLLRYRKQEEIA